jgi:hypothetical protein
MSKLTRPSEIDPRYSNEKYVGELLYVEPLEVEHDVALGDKTYETVVSAKVTICSGPDTGKVYEDMKYTGVALVRVASKSIGKPFAARLTQPDRAYVFADVDESDEEQIIKLCGLEDESQPANDTPDW